MTDLLIRLYDLPEFTSQIHAVEEQGIILRRARAYEKHQLVKWVRNHFGHGWASECDVAFSRQPISCMIATEKGAVSGFACYDATCRGFFGPIGIVENARGRGVGTGLLAKCLEAMVQAGYAYAVVGDGQSAVGFYSRYIEVIDIPGSATGIYSDRLRLPKDDG